MEGYDDLEEGDEAGTQIRKKVRSAAPHPYRQRPCGPAPLPSTPLSRSVSHLSRPSLCRYQRERAQWPQETIRCYNMSYRG